MISIFLDDSFCCCFLYEFIQFECLPISLKWMSSVIFNCCHTIMPCRTVRRSDFVADLTTCNFMEDFVLMNLLAAAVSASPVPRLVVLMQATKE